MGFFLDPEARIEEASVAPTMQSILPEAVVLDAAAVDGLSWRRLSGMGQARSKLVWRAGDSVAGVMEVDPHGVVPAHVHPGTHHHVWVLSGRCSILGSELGPGAYVHIPAGVEHSITGVGADGCRFFYLYVDAAAL